MNNLLITGRPGIGKTTVVRKVVETVRIPVGGFYTEEIRAAGGRLGFRVVDLDGPKGLLSHVDRSKVSRSEGTAPPRVGKYHVDVAGFEEVGLGALRNALLQRDLIVVDEIGKMELFSRPFRDLVVEALDSPKTLIAVIHQKSDPFTDSIRSRPDVDLLTVTRENRDRLPTEIAEVLHQA